MLPIQRRSKVKFVSLRLEQLEDRLAPAVLVFRGVSADILNEYNWQDQQDSSIIRAATATDDLVIANAASLANVNLTLNANSQFASLRLDEGFTLTVGSSLTLGGLNLHGGTLTGNGPMSVATFTFMGGTLAGSSQLYIGSNLSWQNGSMAGSGTTTIASGANASISTPSGMSAPLLADTRVFVNAGTTEWHAPTFGATASIVNNGTMTIRGGTFTYNAATLVQTSASASLKFENCTVNLTGPLTVGGSVALGRQFDPCTVNVDGAVSMTNLRVFANISGSGTITVSGVFTWDSGTFTGPGSFVVGPTGTFTMGDYISGGRILNGASLIVNGQRALAPIDTSIYIGMTLYTGDASNPANYGGWLTNRGIRPTSNPTVAFNASAAAGAIYRAMFGGVTGATTDEDAIYQAMEGMRTEADVAQLTAAYARQWNGRVLLDDLRSELSGDELKRAEALYRPGNPPETPVSTPDWNRYVAVTIHEVMYSRWRPGVYVASFDVDLICRLLADSRTNGTEVTSKYAVEYRVTNPDGTTTDASLIVDVQARLWNA